MKPSRRFRLQLAGACLLGLVLQALFRWLEWGADPLARVPLDDAGVYWDWAGAIAGGRLVGDEPFLSAPLYPYFLGLLRALGPCRTPGYPVSLRAAGPRGRRGTRPGAGNRSGQTQSGSGRGR